jgi:hypothetical protein
MKNALLKINENSISTLQKEIIRWFVAYTCTNLLLEVCIREDSDPCIKPDCKFPSGTPGIHCS